MAGGGGRGEPPRGGGGAPGCVPEARASTQTREPEGEGKKRTTTEEEVKAMVMMAEKGGISKEDVVKALGKTAKRFVCKDWKEAKGS